MAPIGEPSIPATGKFKYFDKIAHFGLFMTTGCIIVFGSKFFSRFRYRMFFGIALGLILAVGTEFAQYLIPARNMSLFDLLTNVLGLSLGLLLYAFLHHRYAVR
jgi:VanZ family protein